MSKCWNHPRWSDHSTCSLISQFTWGAVHPQWVHNHALANMQHFYLKKYIDLHTFEQHRIHTSWLNDYACGEVLMGRQVVSCCYSCSSMLCWWCYPMEAYAWSLVTSGSSLHGSLKKKVFSQSKSWEQECNGPQNLNCVEPSLCAYYTNSLLNGK